MTRGSAHRANRAPDAGFDRSVRDKDTTFPPCRGRLSDFHGACEICEQRNRGETCMRTTRTVIGIVAVLMLCGTFFSAQTATTTSSEPTAVPNRAAYCLNTGGEVEYRFPAYGTNGPSQDWLRLAGRQ